RPCNIAVARYWPFGAHPDKESTRETLACNNPGSGLPATPPRPGQLRNPGLWFGNCCPGKNLVELHSNYTIEGSGQEVNGVLPSRHAFHETLEITHGFTTWFETGFYVFSSIQPGHGWEWVATTSGHECACPRNGTGRSGSVFRLR